MISNNGGINIAVQENGRKNGPADEGGDAGESGYANVRPEFTGSTGKEIICETGYGSKIGKKEKYIINLEINFNAYLNDALNDLYIPKNAYTGAPEPVTHAYGESPISSRGNLYYSQAEVDQSLSGGDIEGAKTKYPKKEMIGGHSKSEQYNSVLPIWLLVQHKDPFYDDIKAKIKYLNADERKKYEVNVKDGKLTAGGKTLHTIGAESLSAPIDRNLRRDQRIKIESDITDTWIFVMDPNGSIYAADWVSEYKKGGFYDALKYFGPAPKQIVGFNHSSLVAGEAIAAAGEIKVNNGKLELLSNKSGHYWPKPHHILNFMYELLERDPNFSFKNVVLELMTTGNRNARGELYDAEDFFNKSGNNPKKLEDDEPDKPEVTFGGYFEDGLTRASCLAQHENTCGQRAAFNALKFKANPDDPYVAAEAMADDAALRRIGPMQTDVYDDYVRDILDRNNGDDIALVSSLQRVRDFVNRAGEYPYDAGEDNLYEWAHKGRVDVVNLIFNTKAVDAELQAKPQSERAGYGHYIAVQLVRREKGTVWEKELVFFADSLGEWTEEDLKNRKDLIKSLLQALKPQ